uniref:3'(2'),5'-bisphosphate nucleotidase n=1 Tax=Hucho hucho TaxID=62062 RepID=A0A4W5RXB7_9TELE
MLGNPAVVTRLVAYAVAEKAGAIMQRVLHSGELRIMAKVGLTERRVGQSSDVDTCVKSTVCSIQLTCHLISGLLDHVTVLIGIAYGGKAIAGVINQPSFNYQTADMGRTLWGMPGLGAFGFELQEVPDGRRIVTTTRSHSNKLVIDTVDAMKPHVIRVGGAGNIQGWYGGGKACVFASLGTKVPCCYDANVKHMNSAGVLATLHNHQYYTSKVLQSVLQALKP